MKAIVYTSGTGFTKRYAEMLSAKLNIPCVELKQALKNISHGEEIFYLGWVYANNIQGLKKAAKHWKVSAVGAVGMYPYSETNNKVIIEANKLSCPMFYMHGGLKPEKINGINKLLLSMVCKFLTKDDKPENADTIKAFKEGCDFVSEENISAAVAYMLMKK